MNLQRRLWMSWELMLNVKPERPFKWIVFQDVLHLLLSNSTVAILAHLKQSFSYNKIYYGLYGGEHVTIEGT